MWRSGLCLRDGWRHLLNRPSGGPVVSVQTGTDCPSLFRAYVPPAERKRFYQNVSITQGEGGFEINLDHRKLKTPQAKLFTVPSEALAIAVATEWDSQQDTIKFYTMHLVTARSPSPPPPLSLSRAPGRLGDSCPDCSKALGGGLQPQLPPQMCPTVPLGVGHLQFPLLGAVLAARGSYRVEEPETLVELQKNEWDPILEWAERRFGVEIGSSTSILGPSIPARTREVLASHLASYSTWALQGIEFVVAQLKSMLLTLGLLDLRLTVEQAVLLSRLEEEYQIQKWGNVEWAHDYELQELRARTAAGTLFVHLCSESTGVKHKLPQE
uniref:ATP synthase mitochondrial F1 complex assembly factor 2 n=1 Tax=Molossus molossus TaxID=27622 RepID=A0A7J8BJT0_MOLMO|nr:ATP synthase mitochondrial F1 complex assembly factor 2 [Molossus molossus]